MTAFNMLMNIFKTVMSPCMYCEQFTERSTDQNMAGPTEVGKVISNIQRYVSQGVPINHLTEVIVKIPKLCKDLLKIAK